MDPLDHTSAVFASNLLDEVGNRGFWLCTQEIEHLVGERTRAWRRCVVGLDRRYL